MNPRLDDAVRPPASGVAAWALGGAVLYVVIGYASIFIVALGEQLLLAPFGLAAEAGTSSWGIVLASHPIAWGIATALAAAWLGGRLIPGGLRFTIVPAAILGVGLALAAITTYLLHEFVRERFGWFDPEYAGLVLFAAPALVAVGLAGWAGAVAPRGSTAIVFAAHAAAVAGLGLAILPSAPGLHDGIRASSIPLATVLAFDVAYATGSLMLAARDLRRRKHTTEPPGR